MIQHVELSLIRSDLFITPLPSFFLFGYHSLPVVAAMTQKVIVVHSSILPPTHLPKGFVCRRVGDHLLHSLKSEDRLLAMAAVHDASHPLGPISTALLVVTPSAALDAPPPMTSRLKQVSLFSEAQYRLRCVRRYQHESCLFPHGCGGATSPAVIFRLSLTFLPFSGMCVILLCHLRRRLHYLHIFVSVWWQR